jgi:hypothetical protein
VGAKEKEVLSVSCEVHGEAGCGGRVVVEGYGEVVPGGNGSGGRCGGGDWMDWFSSGGALVLLAPWKASWRCTDLVVGMGLFYKRDGANCRCQELQ